MDSSVGANKRRAIRSESRQNADPPRKHAGISIRGFAVLKSLRIRWGTATPTKDTGPAKAVTVAESRDDTRISIRRKTGMLTPADLA